MNPTDPSSIGLSIQLFLSHRSCQLRHFIPLHVYPFKTGLYTTARTFFSEITLAKIPFCHHLHDH